MLDRVPDSARPADQACLVEFAPAKINLALHVVGQRADGYHLLESIVAFASEGDRLRIAAATEDAFSVSGRFAANLPVYGIGKQQNLVLTARDLLRAGLKEKGVAAPPVALHLKKNLPVASGIGGGSADAAAVLRGLSRLWASPLGGDELAALALQLGADVPMCLRNQPLLACGIGDDITPLPDLPSYPIVLGNPLVSVSTPDIFRRLTTKNNSPIRKHSGHWRSHLGELRNDLEPVARGLLPEIEELSEMITAEGAWLTRMSGSGATCFGLFDTWAQAEQAAASLSQKRPDWYFAAATTGGAAS